MEWKSTEGGSDMKKILTAAFLSLLLPFTAQASVLPQDYGPNQGGMVQWESDLYFFRLDQPVWEDLLTKNRSFWETNERDLEQAVRDLDQSIASAAAEAKGQLEAEKAEKQSELRRAREAVLLYLSEEAKTKNDLVLLTERPDKNFLDPLIFPAGEYQTEAQKILEETYSLPCAGKETSPFGWRIHPVTGIRTLHEGIDLANGEGTPIHASKSGIVTFAGFNEISGNNVLIRHYDGQQTSYYHMWKLKVKRGQYVHQGDVIGLMGTTGRSTGNHLHFEIRINGAKVDPAPYIYQGTRWEWR